MMKIADSGPTAGPDRRRNTAGAVESPGCPFSGHVGTGAAPTTRPVAAPPRAALDGVVAAQTMPELAEERCRATRHRRGVLDELQALQIATVEGWMSEAALRRLAGLLDRLGPAGAGPELPVGPEEIELRAAVELARGSP
jgi:hypothetical protein